MNTYQITRYGHDFHILVDDEIMEATYRDGNLCEYHMLDWMERNLPRGGLWIDAGANIGNHALAFSLWASRVLAFEPMPVNFDLLQFNLENNPRASNVVPVRKGVGDKFNTASGELGGTGKNCQWVMKPDPFGVLDICAIDMYLWQEQHEDLPVRVIKLDVEGMEPQAITGAWGTITKHLPELFIEIWDEAILADITATLAPLGYVLTERYNAAPTFHFSASGRYPVTYTPAARLRP